MEDLYRSILPPPIGESSVEQRDDRADAAAIASPDEEARDGFYLGSVKLKPAFDALYVKAEGALLDTAAPVDDRYYELRPQIGAEAPIGTGVLRAAYQARIRKGSSFEVVDSTTSHLADLSFKLPIGSFEITGAEHFARGVLETTEVDAGREYFFRLGRFTRHQHNVGLRFVPGSRVDATVGGSLNVVRVADDAAFFDHEEQFLSAQIGYELRPALRAALSYGHTRIPYSVDRPQADSRSSSWTGELNGELLPLTSGFVSLGYFRQTSPNAGPGGTGFTGLTASGRLEKSFTPSSSVTLAGARATHLSNFEQNAFYLASAVTVLVRAGLPASFALLAGAGYHQNEYRTVASGIGEPRRDTIRGWTLGLGRPVTRHAFVRADYRRERRDSNLDVFDSRSNALTLQLGLGFFGAPPR